MSKLQALYERIPAGALMSAERLYGWALKRAADHFVGHRLEEGSFASWAVS